VCKRGWTGRRYSRPLDHLYEPRGGRRLFDAAVRRDVESRGGGGRRRHVAVGDTTHHVRASRRRLALDRTEVLGLLDGGTRSPLGEHSTALVVHPRQILGQPERHLRRYT